LFVERLERPVQMQKLGDFAGRPVIGESRPFHMLNLERHPAHPRNDQLMRISAETARS
jgi:hypothetical protein